MVVKYSAHTVREYSFEIVLINRLLPPKSWMSNTKEEAIAKARILFKKHNVEEKNPSVGVMSFDLEKKERLYSQLIFMGKKVLNTTKRSPPI